MVLGHLQRLQKQGVRVPKIHLLIGNRLTQFDGPAKAFAALSDAAVSAMYDIYVKCTDYFVPSTVQINSKDKLR